MNNILLILIIIITIIIIVIGVKFILETININFPIFSNINTVSSLQQTVIVEIFTSFGRLNKPKLCLILVLILSVSSISFMFY